MNYLSTSSRRHDAQHTGTILPGEASDIGDITTARNKFVKSALDTSTGAKFDHGLTIFADTINVRAQLHHSCNNGDVPFVNCNVHGTITPVSHDVDITATLFDNCVNQLLRTVVRGVVKRAKPIRSAAIDIEIGEELLQPLQVSLFHCLL